MKSSTQGALRAFELSPVVTIESTDESWPLPQFGSWKKIEKLVSDAMDLPLHSGVKDHLMAQFYRYVLLHRDLSKIRERPALEVNSLERRKCRSSWRWHRA